MDHARTLTLAVADGAMPSSEGWELGGFGIGWLSMRIMFEEDALITFCNARTSTSMQMPVFLSRL